MGTLVTTDKFLSVCLIISKCGKEGSITLSGRSLVFACAVVAMDESSVAMDTVGANNVSASVFAEPLSSWRRRIDLMFYSII